MLPALVGAHTRPPDTSFSRFERQPMIKPGSASILSPSTRIVGDLNSEDEIVLSGTFEGTLRSTRSVQIANSGRLTGEIHADTVTVLGQVHGPIHAFDRIELQGGAVVHGDLTAQRVRIHDDVIFNGNCKITGAESARRQYLLPAMVQSFGTPAAAQELSRVATAAETFLNEFGFDVELRADKPSDGAQTLRPIFRSREALPFGRLRERLRGVEQALQNAASPDAPKPNRFGGFLKKTDSEAPLQTTGADGARGAPRRAVSSAECGGHDGTGDLDAARGRPWHRGRGAGPSGLPDPRPFGHGAARPECTPGLDAEGPYGSRPGSRDGSGARLGLKHVARPGLTRP